MTISKMTINDPITAPTITPALLSLLLSLLLSAELPQLVGLLPATTQHTL